MRSGAQQVAEGVHLVNEAEESLRQINQEMARTAEMVDEISHASNEQQSAMIELAQSVERVANMTEQNVAVVRSRDLGWAAAFRARGVLPGLLDHHLLIRQRPAQRTP